MALKFMNAVPLTANTNQQSNTTGEGTFKDSAVFSLVHSIQEKTKNGYNGEPKVLTQVEFLKKMLGDLRVNKQLSERDADKLIYQHFDCSVASLSHEDKVAIINECCGTNFAVPGSSYTEFKTMLDVAKGIATYVAESGLDQFDNSEIGKFKQVYNKLAEIYIHISDIVNGNIKDLWNMYKNIRDSYTTKSKYI